MFSKIRISGFASRLSVVSTALFVLAGLGSSATAQTAPQLLPYTSKLIAGGGSTAATKGAACSRTGAAPSGNVSYDIYGDGCLASEISLNNPKDEIVDATGAIYFTDYFSSGTNSHTGVIHRIDPVTGIVTAVAGGVTTIPAAAANCSTTTSSDPNKVLTGDVFGDGCLATSVKLEQPTGIAFSPSGDLYIADEYAYNVRKVSFSNGGVAAVIINNGGSSYASAPTVTFSAPPSGGTTATGTAVINSSGAVISVTITNSGSGYTSAPTVTFSVAPTGNTTATGTAVYTGVISMAVGSNGGTSATAHGYGLAAPCSTSATATVPCVLDAVYSLAFDKAGNLYLPDEFYEALYAVNTNASGTTTALGVSVPAGTMVLVAGSKSGGCTNGTASSNGCTFGTYTSNTAALQTFLDNPYGVTIDSYGNAYLNDYYYGNVAQISAGSNFVNGGTSSNLNGASTSTVPPANYINSYAGSYPLSHTYATVAASKRGLASTFSIGADYGLGMDVTNNNNNLYVTDQTNGYIWRVDGATQTMYVVGGGATPPASGSACSLSFPGSSMTSTDAYGDGCPATLGVFGKTYLFDVSTDTYGDVFVADNGPYLYREIASGTQFGNVGATKTDYVDIHFAAGDTPLTTGAYTITSGVGIFTVGTTSCTLNTDNNGSSNTTDCIVAITATPSASGPFTGTLTVKSTLVPAGTSFPLTGDFIQSPVTRIGVSTSSAVGCSGTIYATTTPVTLTATLTANGPSAPTGTIIFYSNGVALAPATGVAVTNIGTSSAPVYGATLPNTFSTANTYAITATYVPTSGSYFTGSTSLPVSITSSTPTFSATALSPQQSTVAPGQTALYSFTVATAVYTGTITFACSGLPANSSCSFSPVSITAAGCSITDTVALSILTQAATTVQPAGFGGTGSGPWQMLAALGGVGLALMIGLFRRRIPMRYGQFFMALALLLAASGMIACGKPVGSILIPATPAGTSTVTVTATGTDGTAAHFTVPLTVN